MKASHLQNVLFAFVAGICSLTFLHKGDPIAGACALFLIVYLVAQGRS